MKRKVSQSQPAAARIPAINRFISRLLKFAAAIISISVAISTLAAPPAGVLDEAHPAVRTVIAVQAEITPDLMRQPEILGTAVGVDTKGISVLTIYVDRDSSKASEVIRNLPREFRGVGVRIHLTDKFHAMSISHTAKQTPPIQLGTSGGWVYDLANGFCCGGTLGSLVKIGSTQYILSNYHVFESDIVSGGNNRTAQTGDPIIQPGLIDVSCNKNLAQTVGTLVKKSSLPGNNVDCAIAKVASGMVRTDGAILEIGTISNTTVGAFINQAVKKSGRTTGLTHSSVSGLNATISVAYDNECAGGTAFTKTFTGQIVVANSGNKFLDSGDSGSLMVEDVATKPRAVGLLFAGSSTDAIANPIGQVLTFLGATMVGGRPNWPDFDGDGKADISVFRSGAWYVLKSSTNTVITRTFGTGTDKIAPADYDRDGKTDFAVFRNGFWYISQSSNGQLRTVQWGQSGDLPIPGDFDGDGKADIAVFRPSDGTWHYIKSSNGQSVAAQFGANGDVPLLGDFDGDGKSDLAVFRPSTAYWFYRRSSDGQLRSIHFGASSDIPVPGDYDGDGVSDTAVFRPTTGFWYRRNSSNGAFVAAQWGTNGDKPVPADYDNDGKTDLAIYRGATWYVRRSADNSVLIKNFGVGTDVHVPAAYLRQ
jgi:VCBS repeat protein